VIRITCVQKMALASVAWSPQSVAADGYALHESRKTAGESGPRGHACRQSIDSASRLESLGRLGCLAVGISRPRLTVLMLSNPLNRVIFRNKALDYFRFAIGPQNINPQPEPGFFRATMSCAGRSAPARSGSPAAEPYTQDVGSSDLSLPTIPRVLSAAPCGSGKNTIPTTD
jgi:hypothetical protein